MLLIVDPPDGRILPLIPQAQKIVAAEREFRLALLQSTETCKKKLPGCSGGKSDPMPSPRRADLPPRYNTSHRYDRPEDGGLAERCLTAGVAARYRYERKPTLTGSYSPVEWRLARPLGGQYAP